MFNGPVVIQEKLVKKCKIKCLLNSYVKCYCPKSQNPLRVIPLNPKSFFRLWRVRKTTLVSCVLQHQICKPQCMRFNENLAKVTLKVLLYLSTPLISCWRSVVARVRSLGAKLSGNQCSLGASQVYARCEERIPFKVWYARAKQIGIFVTLRVRFWFDICSPGMGCIFIGPRYAWAPSGSLPPMTET